MGRARMIAGIVGKNSGIPCVMRAYRKETEKILSQKGGGISSPEVQSRRGAGSQVWSPRPSCHISPHHHRGTISFLLRLTSADEPDESPHPLIV
jgi:hypothetical protein